MLAVRRRRLVVDHGQVSGNATRAAIIGSRLITGLTADAMAELHAKMGPLWRERHQAGTGHGLAAAGRRRTESPAAREPVHPGPGAAAHLRTDAAAHRPNGLGDRWLKEWAARSTVIRVPPKVTHRERWQVAVDMLDTLASWGMGPPVVVADATCGVKAHL